MSDERARIYLTNALEPASDAKEQREFEEWAPALAHEAKAVNAVKRQQRFTVVIGNPPYSGNSSNRGEWIESLINDYREVEGKPLGEVKVWLKDDYVKFTRLGELILTTTGVGILGFITNNSFFDGLTFRGMRYHLLSQFARGYFLNLHGNGKLNEKAPDGTPDENVFDILQGVGITLLIKNGPQGSVPTAYSTDLLGTREQKYAWLETTRSMAEIYAVVKPKTPNFFVVLQGGESCPEYELFTAIIELFEIGGLGFQSHRDSFVVAFSSEELTARMKDFFNLAISDKEIKERYSIDDYRRFVVRQFRRQNKFRKSCLVRLQYRPFDYRYIYYARDIVQEWQIRFHGHLLKPNLGLNVMRQTKAPAWQHVMVSSTPTPAVFVEIKDGSSQFPLYLYSDFDEPILGAKKGRSPNLSEQVVVEWFDRLNITPSWLQETSGLAQAATPEDVFYYAYAVFHSPGYRSRYADYLKIDFPRLPLSGNYQLFLALVQFGAELVTLHLLESPKLDQPIATYTGPRNPQVDRVGWSNATVWLDAPATKKGQPAKPGTIGFRGVSEAVWNFHIGGYQVCEKWLKDRKGRKLLAGDLAHYQRVIVALHETIGLMQRIDEVINQHGGWPGAFATIPPVANP